jgi:uncharacterized protein (TIGR02270 family)
LLDSASPFRRGIGLTTCGLHLVNPGSALASALATPELQPDALRLAAKLSDTRRTEACCALVKSPDTAMQMLAARAALLIGERETAVSTLTRLASDTSPLQQEAMCLVVKVLSPADAGTLLRPLAQAPAHARTLMRGIAAAGDPHYIPWLIKQMDNQKLARLAAEAFSMITGLDLAYLDLDRKPPEGAVFGPNDDPADADVAMDEDDSLPWPDIEKIRAWWEANGLRFRSGTRYFVGEQPSAAHCLSVLKKGFQRQRIAAAEYLCLLNPGTPLFNVAAPARRQERLLAQMEA